MSQNYLKGRRGRKKQKRGPTLKKRKKEEKVGVLRLGKTLGHEIGKAASL